VSNSTTETHPADNPQAVLEALLGDASVVGDTDLESRLHDLKSSAPPPSAAVETRDSFVIELSRLLFHHSQQAAMQLHNLPFPVYNHLEDFFANERRPWAPPLPERPVAKGRKWRLFGKEIGIPLGISASVLTMNSKWIRNHSENGFNVLTYKTVRTKERPPLGNPNWIFLDTLESPISPHQISDGGIARDVKALGDIDSWPANSYRFSTANSFGVPSKDPSEWIPDVQETLSVLANDQILILSLMGTFEEKHGDDLVADFEYLARLASETGTPVVEINLSCPNGVIEGHALPPIDRNPEQVQRIVERVRSALDPTTALVVKFGYMKKSQLEKTLKPIASIVDGVSGINTLQLPVKDPSGMHDTFPGRSQAGVSGSALRDLAYEFVTNLAELRRSFNVTYDIIAMGGAMTPADVVRFYEAGASAIQAASGAFFNPYLARDLVAEFGDSFPHHELIDFVDEKLARANIIKTLKASGPLTLADLSAEIGQAPSIVKHAVDSLVQKRAVRSVGSANMLTQVYMLE
jgi:dihydroorotate dehydrogenase